MVKVALLVFAGFDFDRAVVGFDDSDDDGEAEARAAFLGGGEQAFENSFALVLAHAVASIAKFDHYKTSGFRGSRGLRPRRDFKPAALRHRFNGVQREVEEDLFELGDVGHDERQIGIEVGD